MYLLKIWLGLTVLLILRVSGYAAIIENVKADIDEHDRLVVNYDFNGSSTGVIYLSVSEDGNVSFDNPLSVSGDIGPGVEPGIGKRIIWDIFMDTPAIKTDRLVARVSIVPPEELASEPALKQKVTRSSKQFRPGKPSHRKLDRARLVLKSAVVPGWGQTTTGRKRGYIYMIGYATALGAAYLTSTYYEDEKKKYYNERDLHLQPDQTYSSRKYHEDEMMKHYDNMKLYHDVNLVAFITAGLIYGWNLIEVGTLDIGLSPNHAGLSVSYNF